MERGRKNAPVRYRKLLPGDGVERSIVGILFAVTAVGVYVMTGATVTAVLVGALLASVAVGVITQL